jgi:hypothetical protein
LEAHKGALEAHNEPWMVFRPLVTDLHYGTLMRSRVHPDTQKKEKLDLDPHQSDKSDPDPR